MADQNPKLGFIGTGLMGGPISARLLDAGSDLTVWNRTPGKMRPLIDLGAAAAAGPAGVAAAAEIVFMCLTDAAAVEEVVFGDSGVAGVAAPEKLLVDFSSMRPDVTRRLAAKLKGETGMGWVDAPVSGGVAGAEKGTLAILAGGEAADIDRIRPILKHLSQRVTHMGPSGAGQVTKLCNQAIVGCNFAVIAEAIRLAEVSGVDAAKLPEALKGGFADSQPLQIFGPRFAARQTDPILGYVDTLLKDIDSARDLAEAGGVDLPMTSGAGDLMRLIVDRGHARHDIGTLMTLYDAEEEAD